MSLVCQAFLKSRTMAAWLAVGAAAASAARTRRRPDEASCGTAAGVRPTMPAISPNG
jgi:hypothetical protein